MGNIYITKLTVPASAIDANQHVNNLAYLHWIQGLIIDYSLDKGCTIRHLKKNGGTWAIVSHSIDYFASASENDDIVIFSWIGRLGEKSLDSHFIFYRASDDTVLVEARTTFVYVNISTGKGMTLPQDLRTMLAETDEGHPLLRTLRAETRDLDAIARATSSARPMSEASVNSLTMHRALIPSRSYQAATCD